MQTAEIRWGSTSAPVWAHEHVCPRHELGAVVRESAEPWSTPV